MTVAWQGSRARLAELQLLGPGGLVVAPLGLLAVLGIMAMVGRGRRLHPPWSRPFALVAIVAAGGAALDIGSDTFDCCGQTVDFDPGHLATAGVGHDRFE